MNEYTDRDVWKSCRIHIPKAGACPSPETLAAWVDNSLAGQEKQKMEQHVLQCHRCLETVLLLRRVLDDTLEKPAVSPAPVHTPIKENTFSRFWAGLLKEVFQSRSRAAAILAGIVCISMGSFFLGGQLAVDSMIVQDAVAKELFWGVLWTDESGVPGGEIYR